jgi:hypothetical protein
MKSLQTAEGNDKAAAQLLSPVDAIRLAEPEDSLGDKSS